MICKRDLERIKACKRQLISIIDKINGKKSTCAINKLEDMPLFIESWVIPELDYILQDNPEKK